MTRLTATSLLLLCALGAVGLLGCGDRFAHNGSTRPRYTYTIRLPAFHEDSLRITLLCEPASTGSLLFALPFVYADNPVDSFIGPLVNDLAISDAAGVAQAYSSTHVEIGPVESRVITVATTSDLPLELSYGLDFDMIATDTRPRAIPRCYVDNRNAFFVGSYIFAIPYRDVSLSHLWREPLPIDVGFDVSDDIAVAGASSEGLSLNNIYELLFLHLAFGFEPVVSGSAEGHSYAIYDLRSSPAGTGAYSTIADRVNIVLEDVTTTFGALDADIFHIMYHDDPVGLEATFGFASYAPHLAAPDSLYNNLLVHETIHHFVGVHCGDYDDPWWKEGITNYLGYVTAARAGLVSAEAFRSDVLRSFDFSAGKYQHPLSSEFVRKNLYAEGLEKLVYGKGAQVAMLLDHRVRGASGNRVRLDDVIAELTRRYRGRGFHRADMVALFDALAGADVAPLLRAYVDRVGTIPDSVLNATFNDLRRMGAFGPRITKLATAPVRTSAGPYPIAFIKAR